MELFSKKELEKRELQRQKRYWQKERKNKQSRYSDSYIEKNIKIIERKLKED